MVVPEANNPRTSTDLTHQRNRGHARALANNPKATDTTEHRATRVLQRNRPVSEVRERQLSGNLAQLGKLRSRPVAVFRDCRKQTLARIYASSTATITLLALITAYAGLPTASPRL